MKNFALLILIVAALVTQVKAINPPGTKKVKIDNEIFYIDQEEICVADWLEYMRYTEHQYGKTSEEFKLTLPQGFDTKETVAKEKLMKPLTGITLEQAKKYCKWRTSVVNAVNEETGSAKVLYTIPTEQQYSKLIKTFGAYEILSAKNTTSRITGLQSGVFELTDDGSVLKNSGIFSKEEKVPSENVGFRCVATIEK